MPTTPPVAPAHPQPLPEQWADPFAVLRQKWGEVPAGLEGRDTTERMLSLPDEALRSLWLKALTESSTGPAYSVRGWYHDLYKDVLRGKKVLEIGGGMAFDAVTFGLAGAKITMVDIVESNVAMQRRLCGLFGLPDFDFLYMKDIASLESLPSDFDVIWCQGSLINAPFAIIRDEIQELVRHLKIGGRWIELAYPKARWEREGRLPFELWGKRTDGEATPWVEWYDLDKLRAALSPARFDVVLAFEFHNSDFNWFDLIRRS